MRRKVRRQLHDGIIRPIRQLKTTNARHRKEQFAILLAASNKRRHSCPGHQCFEKFISHQLGLSRPTLPQLPLLLSFSLLVLSFFLPCKMNAIFPLFLYTNLLIAHFVAAALLFQRRPLRGNCLLSSLFFHSHFYFSSSSNHVKTKAGANPP